jgi:D-aspartate ligase
MPAPVLILGQGLTLLGTVRCFGRARVPAYVLTGPDPLAGSSRWFRAWPSATLPPYGYDELPAALAQLDLERAVLVPCSDRWAAAVGRLGPGLEERFPSVVAPPAVIETLVDKGRFGRALQAAGVPHPRTFEVAAPEDLAAIPDEVLAGGFLKPRDSVAFFGAFGLKAFDFQGRAEATAALARSQAAGLTMLLQEYIPGPADRHYFIDGVVARAGGFSVLFARRRLRIHPPRFGNSTSMTSVPLEEVRDAVESLETLAPRLGLRGIFSAEFKHDPRDGRFKLIEVNPRPWWYVEYAATCGADVCVPAYRDALGLPVPAARPYRVGVRLVYPYYDWPAWRQSATSLSGMLRFWIGATQPEWRRDDPWPAITSLAGLARGWVARRLPGRFRGTSP